MGHRLYFLIQFIKVQFFLSLALSLILSPYMKSLAALRAPCRSILITLHLISKQRKANNITKKNQEKHFFCRTLASQGLLPLIHSLTVGIAVRSKIAPICPAGGSSL